MFFRVRNPAQQPAYIINKRVIGSLFSGADGDSMPLCSCTRGRIVCGRITIPSSWMQTQEASHNTFQCRRQSLRIQFCISLANLNFHDDNHARVWTTSFDTEHNLMSHTLQMSAYTTEWGCRKKSSSWMSMYTWWCATSLVHQHSPGSKWRSSWTELPLCGWQKRYALGNVCQW